MAHRLGTGRFGCGYAENEISPNTKPSTASHHSFFLNTCTPPHNMEKPALYLIDAYASIYRSHFAFNKVPRINSKGENVNALYGFSMNLFDFISKYKPQYLAVVFDPKGGSFRKDIYSEYKANRDSTPEEILYALPYIERLLNTLNIKTIVEQGFEADDVIGALAHMAANEGHHVYMYTPDKDYAQFVTQNITLLRQGKNDTVEMKPEDVCREFGLQNTAQVVDYLAIVGDSADNIPGCKGIGEKGASKLLMQYLTVEDIYNHIESVPASLREKLLASKEQVLLSKELAKANINIPTRYQTEDLKLPTMDKEAVVALLQSYEFPSIIRKHFKNVQPQQELGGLFAMQQPPVKSAAPTEKKEAELFKEPQTDAVKEADDSSVPDEVSFHKHPAHYKEITSRQQLEEVCQKAKASGVMAFDTETDGLNTLTCHLVGVSLAPEVGDAYFMYLPTDAQEAAHALTPLAELFRDASVTKIAQNAKFDTQVLHRYRVPYPNPLFDTMLAHYILQPERPHGLDPMALEMLKHNNIPYSSLSTKKNFSIRTDVPKERLIEYAAEDADVALRLQKLLQQRLKEENGMQLFQEVEMPLLRVIKEMEEVGVRIDRQALTKAATALEHELEHTAQKIYQTAGKEFNINSPAQVGKLLFEELTIDKKPKKTKSGGYATNEEVLLQYENEHPIVHEILEYRGINKLLSTYIYPFPEYIADDGRIHTSYNQAVTATGRLSSSNPNMQNIPIRSAVGQELRTAFVASDEQHTFLSADYSQIELRLTAHLSKDEGLIDAFTKGVDVHSSTAAKIYGIPEEQVTPLQRSFAKTANFGIIYGITPFGLSRRLHISPSLAKELIDNYFAQFPKLQLYMEQCIADAREKGYAQTMLGRRRYLPQLYSANNTQRAMAERTAINAPIQGSAADLIKVAMIKIDSRMKALGLRSKMIMQVHDELNFDVYTPELNTMKEIVEYEMKNALGQLDVPLEVGMGTGNNWLEAH